MKPCHTLAFVASTVVSTPHVFASASNASWSSTIRHLPPEAFLARPHRRVRTAHQRDAPSSHFQHRKHSSTWQRRTMRSHLHVESTPGSPDVFAQNNEKKRKKNKYSRFSKSDNLPLDPLDAMLVESRSKLLEMSQKSKQRKKMQTVNESLEAVEGLLSSLDESIALERDREEEDGPTWERNQRSFPDNKDIDPYDPTTYGYIELGTILGPHGVHGTLKLSSITDFPHQRLCGPGTRHLKPPNRRSPRPVYLTEGRLFQSPPAGSDADPVYLIRLEGVEGREDAAKLRGCVLYCLEEEGTEDFLGRDEYIVSDLVGLNVFLVKDGENATGKGFEDLFVGFVCGVVLGRDICAVPGLGQDMLEVALPSVHGGRGDERVLIPFVPQIVVSVDLKGRMVVIDPPKGLLELSYRREAKVKLKGLLPAAREDR